MPYILSPLVDENLYSQWGEGPPYAREIVKIIDPNNLPPVHIERHTFNPHSMTHIETDKHVHVHGKGMHDFFEGNHFYGMCRVVRFRLPPTYDEGLVKKWVISKDQLIESLDGIRPNKLMITLDSYDKNEYNFMNVDHHLTLSLEAAQWLVENPKFNLCGTSWKTSDDSSLHEDKRYREVHKTLLSQAVILENADLELVPDGEYFLSAYPIRIFNSSESPICPVLFTKDELLSELNDSEHVVSVSD